MHVSAARWAETEEAPAAAAEEAPTAEEPAAPSPKPQNVSIPGIAADDPGLDDEKMDDPERPPEDELAGALAYYEALVWFWRHEDRIMWRRLHRLQDPECLAMVGNRFTAMREKVPRLFEYLEGRLKDRLDELKPSSLAAVAWSFAEQKAGSEEFWEALATTVQRQAEQHGENYFSESHKHNLRNAMLASGHVPDAKVE